jgi:hypothetical protein
MIFLLIIYYICPAGCGAERQGFLEKILDGKWGGCYTPHLYAETAGLTFRLVNKVRKRCFMIMQKGFAGDVTTTGRIPPA